MGRFKALEESRKRPLRVVGDKGYLALASFTSGYFVAIELRVVEERIDYLEFVVIHPNNRSNPVSSEFALLDSAKFRPTTPPNAASLDDLVQMVATKLRHDPELSALSPEARAESLRANPWPLQLYAAQVIRQARAAHVFRDELSFQELLCDRSGRYIHAPADYKTPDESLESWVVRLVAAALS